MNLLASITTTAILLMYFYYADYNREPAIRVIEAFLIGMAISLQISHVQLNFPIASHIIFHAFIIAALVEELIKLLALRLTLFRNPDFTHAVDGITYAVFLSLGFATAENIITINNFEVGIIRAFTATPAHALFAVSMGYYLGLYKFNRHDKRLLLLALLIPTLLHGIYNYLIMSDTKWGLVLFVPYVIFLWVKSTYKLSKLNEEIKKNEENINVDEKS